MLKNDDVVLKAQNEKDAQLLESSRYLGARIESKVIPFSLNLSNQESLTEKQQLVLEGLEIRAARTAILTLASLAKINELDHLGGGLDLISALMMTLAVTDYNNIEYTIENAHTSVGYYASLSAYGFLEETDVIEKFRRGLEIPGHVSWVPGGTQLNGGRLGVMVPVAVGQALGNKTINGRDTLVITHCGDAGWISGQALNGFNAADLHAAPVTFIMHRNGIQLSGSNRQVMDKDPRPIIASLGIKILEIASLHDAKTLYDAYREAFALGKSGIPSMIYPVGYSSSDSEIVNLNTLAKMYNISDEIKEYAQKNNVSMDKEIWIPGSLMSYRDVGPMLDCVFLVNELEGGKGHHDGHMLGRDVEQVLQNPMLAYSENQKSALDKIYAESKKSVITRSRPAPGSKNLVLTDSALNEIDLPKPGKNVDQVS